eukprot:scaffold12689_cov97-Skeletonema_marinoi.AAC.1
MQSSGGNYVHTEASVTKGKGRGLLHARRVRRQMVSFGSLPSSLPSPSANIMNRVSFLHTDSIDERKLSLSKHSNASSDEL